MAKMIGRLTAQQVDSAGLKPGLHSDGGNLYLRVGKDGNISWAFVYRFDGRQREAGLGKAGKGGVPLATARRKAKEGRAMLDGRPPVDPLTVWRPAAEVDRRRSARPPRPTSPATRAHGRTTSTAPSGA